MSLQLKYICWLQLGIMCLNLINICLIGRTFARNQGRIRGSCGATFGMGRTTSSRRNTIRKQKQTITFRQKFLPKLLFLSIIYLFVLVLNRNTYQEIIEGISGDKKCFLCFSASMTACVTSV